jgi:hypothetical protein
MERWKNGIMGKPEDKTRENWNFVSGLNPIFQYSIIPGLLL